MLTKPLIVRLYTQGILCIYLLYNLLYKETHVYLTYALCKYTLLFLQLTVCTMVDPIISPALDFSTRLVSPPARADFLFLCLLHSPAFFFPSLSFFLILTYLIGLKLLHMSNKMGQAEVNKEPRAAHVQDADASAN